MNEPDKNYLKIVRKKMPASKHFSSMIKAFVVGGFICMIGQAIGDIFTLTIPSLEEAEIRSITSMILITVAAILTGFGVYDKIGNFAGAGSVIPITGFSNAVTSAAIEHKREGIVLGLCSKMFIIAGPVIVFGIASSVIVGIIYFIIGGIG